MTYPLVAPAVRPAMRCFWAEDDESSTGRSWTVEAANSTPHSTPSTAPIISDITSGAVLARVVVKMKANRNSFQARR